MRCGRILLLAITLPCWSQTTTTGKAETAGKCSPAVTGSKNTFIIKCGIDKKQGQEMLNILNKILTNQLDPKLVMREIDDIEKGVKEIRAQQEFSELLLPADEPTPDNACDRVRGKIITLPDGVQLPPVDKGALLLILGTSAVFAMHFPETIITIGNDDMLVIDNVGGQIAVSAKLFSSDGKIVAELKKNQFFVNPNNFFRKEHPDEHSLVVFDQEGVEVLNIRFLNPTTIRFLGVIRHPGGNVVISATEGIFATGTCVGEVGPAGAFHFPTH